MNKLTALLRLIMGATLALSIPSFANTELKGNPEELRVFLHPQENRLSLSDFAEETAYADEAVVQLVVTTEEKSLALALEKNTALRESIRQTLVTQGVNAKDINNSKFSTSPQYGWFGKEPNSYKIMNRMAIRIKNEDQLKNIATLSDKHSEVNLAGTQFEHSKKKEFEQKVKAKALENLMTKKAFYEKSLGITLVPYSFNEFNVGQQPTDGAGMLEEIMVTASRTQTDSYVSKRSADIAARESSFDEINYTAHIAVEFTIKR